MSLLRTRAAPEAAKGWSLPVPSGGSPRRASAAGTGTGLAHWGSLHDAWQDALNACSGDIPLAKEPLPVGVVTAIAEHRVRASLAPSDAPDRNPALHPRIVTLQPHARDAQGRNWDARVLDGGTSPLTARQRVDFRRVVDALRDQFDLA